MIAFPVPFLVQSFGEKLHYSADSRVSARHCWFTITWSLWTRRYVILICTSWCDVLRFDTIRSSGSGRKLGSFNKYLSLALTKLLRLQWRLPKIIFIINRYAITSLVLCVMSIHYLPDNISKYSILMIDFNRSVSTTSASLPRVPEDLDSGLHQRILIRE